MLLRRKRHFSDKGLQTYMTLEEKKSMSSIAQGHRTYYLLISNRLKGKKLS